MIYRSICLRLNKAVLAIFTLLLAVGFCGATPPDNVLQLAMANVENPETAGPLHVFKEKKKTTPDNLVLYSVHGSLFNDDPAFQKRSSLWVPVAEITAFNLSLWTYNRYIADKPYAQVSLDTWKNNLENRWWWDEDNLSMNFFLHPFSGAVFFNAARSNGYSFYQSVPFVVGGSLMWEYFGENEPPSYNDLINTSLTGTLMGEMQYRLSSNIIDEKSSGSERTWREIGAALVDPIRGANRLIFGTYKRKNEKEIYQKEPINVVASIGSRWPNDETSFGTGKGNMTIDVNLDYGYPFEYRSRKPFDYFKFWGNLYLGAGDRVLNNLMGYGLLYGQNTEYKDMEILFGIFQHYNFWDNSTFELATLAFGGGVITQLPLGRNKKLLTDLHIGVIPLGAQNKFPEPVDSELRDYNFANGFQAELESTLEIGRVNLTFVGYYYWIHTFYEQKENNYICVLKPRISVNINEFISVGFEHLVYYCDRNSEVLSHDLAKSTEQKLYISYFFKDPWYDR